MNICLLTTTFLPLVGGLELVVHNLATALTKKGHNVYVVTPRSRNGRMKEKRNYHLIRWGFRGYGRLGLANVSAMLTLLYVVKRYKIDVVNFHNVSRPGIFAYQLNKICKNIPLIGTPHGDDIQITSEIKDGIRLNAEMDRIVRRNLGICNYVTAISASIRRDLINLGVVPQKIVNIPNGVWVDDFRKKIDKSKIRASYGISDDNVLMVSVGRNHPRKGFSFGVEAFAKLRRQGHDVYYLLIGREMEPIIKKAKDLGVSSYLIAPGQLSHEKIGQILQSSDIYVSPSIVESFGVTTLEAMSAGLPCVVTDVDGSNDLVRSNFGLLVKPSDSCSLSNGIEQLIINSEMRRKFSKAAIKEAQKYNWTKVSNLYVDAYKNAAFSTA